MVSGRRARRCPIWWCELHATDWLITARNVCAQARSNRCSGLPKAHFLPQVLRLHLHRAAGELHDGLVGGNDAAQENIDADLDSAPIIHAVDHRNHSFFGKVHVLDLLIRPINKITAFQCHVLELREKALVLRGEAAAYSCCRRAALGGASGKSKPGCNCRVCAPRDRIYPKKAPSIPKAAIQ